LLVFVLRIRELLSQVMVVGTQALTERNELIDFRFERREFRIHPRTIVSKILLSQHITPSFECGLPPNANR
jgi:hypothetical protein